MKKLIAIYQSLMDKEKRNHPMILEIELNLQTDRPRAGITWIF